MRLMDDIASRRKALGLSQAELAEKLGLHQSTISRFERGELALDARTMLALEALSARAPATPASEAA